MGSGMIPKNEEEMDGDESDTAGRRSVIKGAGILGASALFPTLSVEGKAQTDENYLGTRHIVEGAIRYQPHDNFPAIHWDGLPEYVFSDNELHLSVLVSNAQVDVFRNSKSVGMILDVTEDVTYQRLNGAVPVPHKIHRKFRITPDKEVEREKIGALPAIVRQEDSGSVTAQIGEEKTKIEPSSSKNITLSSKRASHRHRNAEDEEKSIEPSISITNYGEVDVYAPPGPYQ